MARELTKTFETIIHTTIGDLLELVRNDANQQKGEIVLVVAGNRIEEQLVDNQALHTLKVLLADLPL